MNAKKWFFLTNNLVTGPFTPQEIESKKALDIQALMWGSGLTEWINYSDWKKIVSDIDELEKNSAQNLKTWKYRMEGKELPYMSFSEMIQSIANLNDYKDVEVWNDKMGAWKEIFAFNEVIDQLGITRRTNPRVPIRGEFQSIGFTKGDFKARVTSLSQGGFGISGAIKLEYGDQFKGTITSPHLYSTIHCNCEVIHVGNTPVVGIKFISLPAEAQSAIIEYIKKFDVKK